MPNGYKCEDDSQTEPIIQSIIAGLPGAYVPYRRAVAVVPASWRLIIEHSKIDLRTQEEPLIIEGARR
jgi:hypothetical protein